MKQETADELNEALQRILNESENIFGLNGSQKLILRGIMVEHLNKIKILHMRPIPKKSRGISFVHYLSDNNKKNL